MEVFKEGTEFCKKIIEGLAYSATPYHVVERAKTILKTAGFIEIKENEPWSKLNPGGKYYLTRNLTSILAFSVGGAFDPKTGCLKIVATHTDSPSIKLAPIAKMSKSGYLQPAVQLYGGGIWHTWFDRDLSLAGNVVIRNPETKALEHKLFHCKDALLRIPNLAIHFTREYEKFTFNREQHLRPFLGTMVVDELFKSMPNASAEMMTREFPALLQFLGSELSVDPASIVDFDLNLIDIQPPCFMGIHKEFISSGKIDNQVSCHCGVEAFKDLHMSDYLKNDKNINILVMFDHEEIGSKSMQGALSTYLATVSQRIFHRAVDSPEAEELYNAALRRSFLLSADLAHAINPNYANYHQEAHPVDMNKGVVIKTNHNISYATDTTSSILLKEIGARLKIPMQEFVVKCDSLCGTTVGPLLNTNTCIKTIDIGIGQLAMHSIRETCATTDVLYYYKLLKGFYEEYDKVDRTFLGM